jgi:hypothetical protein
MEKEIKEIKERLKKLEKAVFSDKMHEVSIVQKTENLDFSLNERAFIKKYSSGFNGQKFFTLITAYLVEGQEATPVDLSQIKKIWKSCSGIVGAPYASIFSTRAKENGWVDASKEARGSYVLDKHWRDIISKYENS